MAQYCAVVRSAIKRNYPAGLLEDLQEVMTKDPDAQVVANCMSVLQQVC